VQEFSLHSWLKAILDYQPQHLVAELPLPNLPEQRSPRRPRMKQQSRISWLTLLLKTSKNSNFSKRVIIPSKKSLGVEPFKYALKRESKEI
jgi:hypothetical protein